MKKVICGSCSTRFGNRYMVLINGIYNCGCGYSISEKSYKGDKYLEYSKRDQ